MANEWVKVELLGANRDGEPRRYTVASGTAIAKGTVLKLTDPRTAIADAATSQAAVAGIAAEDKASDDFSTSISCWTQGIFEATASGSGVTIGEEYLIWGNKITESPKDGTITGCKVPGYVLETTANAETVNVRLNL